MDKKFYFHAEQHRASEAALRVPLEQLFILPVALGDCEVPRKLRQYHTVNLLEPSAIEMLLRSLSSAAEHELFAEPDAITRLIRCPLLGFGAAHSDKTAGLPPAGGLIEAVVELHLFSLQLTITAISVEAWIAATIGDDEIKTSFHRGFDAIP